jgi:two-component system chemotaxis response regulator CheB
LATRESRPIQIVTIGASAGGIEALRGLVAALPADFAAAVVVVLHLAPKATSVLPQILTRAGALDAVAAEDGMPLEGGTIYVAPPDCHVLVEVGALRLDHGPRSNGHRPAIDPLFRSAARAYGAAAAGVVLSGVLDDGTAGLMAIKQVGGLTLVQDPDEAVYDTMPRTAIDVVGPDVIGTAAALGATLAAQAEAPPRDPPRQGPTPTEEHVLAVERGSSDRPHDGQVTGLTCPECNGAMWHVEQNGVTRLVCRVGHDYTTGAFAAAQTERVEAALWTALRSLEERAALCRRIAERHTASGSTRTAERFFARAQSAVQHALVIREVLEQLNGADEEAGAA